MSLSLNKVILAGRLTADPEVKQTPSGLAATSFNIAVGRKAAKDADKKTDFISIVAWRQTAEFIGKYFSKGSAICIVGNIQTRSWKDQNGNTRYATEVIAEEVNFVESKASNTANGKTTEQSTVSSQSISLDDFDEISDDSEVPF